MSLMKRRQLNHGTVLGVMSAALPAAPANTAPGLLAGKQLAAFLTASLTEDLKTLKDVSSKERKAEIKRETLLPKYRDYVTRLRGDKMQHEAVGWYLVWLMDSGLMEEGQELARHCVTTGQLLPENFKAEPGYFFADTLLAWAEGEFNAGRSFEPYVTALLDDAAAAPAGWNLPDVILARVHRLRGLAAEKADDFEVAHSELTRALELGGKVKTALDAVAKKLEKPAGTPSQ